MGVVSDHAVQNRKQPVPVGSSRDEELEFLGGNVEVESVSNFGVRAKLQIPAMVMVMLLFFFFLPMISSSRSRSRSSSSHHHLRTTQAPSSSSVILVVVPKAPDAVREPRAVLGTEDVPRPFYDSRLRPLARIRRRSIARMFGSYRNRRRASYHHRWRDVGYNGARTVGERAIAGIEHRRPVNRIIDEAVYRRDGLVRDLVVDDREANGVDDVNEPVRDEVIRIDDPRFRELLVRVQVVPDVAPPELRLGGSDAVVIVVVVIASPPLLPLLLLQIAPVERKVVVVVALRHGRIAAEHVRRQSAFQIVVRDASHRDVVQGDRVSAQASLGAHEEGVDHPIGIYVEIVFRDELDDRRIFQIDEVIDRLTSEIPKSGVVGSVHRELRRSNDAFS
mmetsp:Transcript_20118/g.47208  ORF Transcript_20118/g.47208 Transcript_20118/m.47208 type:complete len:391 (+) Transcript_20118:103-1275(+)